jgi:hypothetical protein
MASYAISFVRAFKSPFVPSAPWHLDILSIGFSFAYVWAIPAVLLGALIGSTQSELAVPRILFLRKPNLEERLRNGAVPSWRPDKWAKAPVHSSETRRNAIRRSAGLSFLAVFLVLLGTVTGLLLSGRIPPEGFGCRAAAETTVFSSYLLSFIVQYALARLGLPIMRHFWLVMAKDIISAGIVAAVIFTTQVGILNRSDCWSLWGKTGVCLPQISKDIVGRRLGFEYPLIIFLTISILFCICAFVGWNYRLALRVYLQRDDGGSNARRFYHRGRHKYLN